MKIKWLGHASFLISSGKGVKILTDPYEAGFRGIINYAPLSEQAADIVTVSHQHGDHNCVSAVKGNPAVVQGPGAHQAHGIEFKGVPSFHDKTAGKERGANTLFCFAVDGLHLCHLGDLGHNLSQDTLKELGQVDILMCPIGGPTATLELDEVLDIYKRLKPRVAIAMHFHTDKCTFPKYGAEDLLKLTPAARRVNATEVEFIQESLPSGQILILDHAL